MVDGGGRIDRGVMVKVGEVEVAPACKLDVMDCLKLLGNSWRADNMRFLARGARAAGMSTTSTRNNVIHDICLFICLFVYLIVFIYIFSRTAKMKHA